MQSEHKWSRVHCYGMFVFFFSSRRRHTRLQGDWSSDVCSSDLGCPARDGRVLVRLRCQLGQATLSRARCEDFLPQYHAGGPAANRTSESQSHVWKTRQAVSHKPQRKSFAKDTSKELPWGAGHLQAVEMPIQ